MNTLQTSGMTRAAAIEKSALYYFTVPFQPLGETGVSRGSGSVWDSDGLKVGDCMWKEVGGALLNEWNPLAM
jgi:hypothetical protein